MTAPEEDIVEEPEMPISAELSVVEVAVEPAEIESVTNEQELVQQKVESEVTNCDAEDFSIVDEPASKVGFVKRWTRKIVGWVKRVFKWRKG